MPDLLTLPACAESARALVEASGEVLRTYDHRTQDSGNVSWLVRTDAGELFAKSAGEPGPSPDGRVPYLDHDARCALLRTAVEVARSVDHPALARLRNVVETATGPVLVYDAAPGELVHVPSAERGDPASAYQRFAHVPWERQRRVFDALLDAHRALAAAGWVAGDLYDGCLIVDADERLTLIDLDSYHRGPLRNDMGDMFGSSRFMAPEEHVLGATIDERTTVFTLGRLVTHFGTRLTDDLARFAGPRAAAQVLARACAPDPGDRFGTVAALVDAWEAAAG